MSPTHQSGGFSLMTIIAAMDQNRLIGVDNTLPWRLSADLQNFKKLTSGNAIIMGRKTWDRSEEHTSELQSRLHLVCRLLLEKKNNTKTKKKQKQKNTTVHTGEFKR